MIHNELDYFYGPQSTQFSFYRIPKLLFQDERYMGISAEAKTLYGILLDRMELSLRNGWLDANGRVYIIFTVEEIMTSLSCANKKAVSLLNELELKAGLIERKRQGLGKPNLIYVKNFIPLNGHFLKCQNDTSGCVENTLLDVSKSHSNHTDYSNTDRNDTDNPSYPERTEGEVQRKLVHSYFWDALDMDALLHDSPSESALLTELFDLIVDTSCTSSRTIRIGGDDKPAEIVRAQYRKLTGAHLVYVLEAIKANTTRIRDMKQYLLTALYNAPMTLNSHYASRVSHDLAVGGSALSQKAEPIPAWYWDDPDSL